MAEMYYVINDVKTGKSYQLKKEEQLFAGKKIGEQVQGSVLGLTGYELKITGASDSAGFPLLGNIEGIGRKSLLLSKGRGAREIKDRGIILRKTVRGNTISDSTVQVNVKVSKYGTKGVPELLGIEVKEEKKEETPAEAKKEAKPEKKEKTKE